MANNIHSDPDRAVLAWDRGCRDFAHDPAIRRNDYKGYPILRADYGKKESEFGWYVELIDDAEPDFGGNLRPVSYRSSSEQAD